MPKLNTTVDKIELTDYKIESTKGLPANNDYWSDKRYPSAKTLYKAYKALQDEQTAATGSLSADIQALSESVDTRLQGINTNTNISSAAILEAVYPVGSLYISHHPTALGTDPGEGYPGTILGFGEWMAVDATFKPATIYITSATGIWKANKANLNPSGYAYFSGNTLVIQLALKTTDVLSASDGTNTLLGQIDLGQLGLKALPYATYQTAGVSDFTDNGKMGIFDYTVDITGKINVVDACTINGTAISKSMAKNATFVLKLIYTFSDPLGILAGDHYLGDNNICTVSWLRVPEGLGI